MKSHVKVLGVVAVLCVVTALVVADCDLAVDQCYDLENPCNNRAVDGVCIQILDKDDQVIASYKHTHVYSRYICQGVEDKGKDCDLNEKTLNNLCYKADFYSTANCTGPSVNNSLFTEALCAGADPCK